MKKRVTEQVEIERREKLPKIFEDARKEGFEAGYQQGKAQADEELRRSAELFAQERQKARIEWEDKNRLDREQMEKLMADFKTEWLSLLNRHEKIWCESMIHLLKQFQVENGGKLGRACEQWLEQTVPEIAMKTPVTVYAAPEKAKQLEEILGGKASNEKWKLIEDVSLDLAPGPDPRARSLRCVSPGRGSCASRGRKVRRARAQPSSPPSVGSR